MLAIQPVADITFTEDECNRISVENIFSGKSLLSEKDQFDLIMKNDCDNKLKDSERYCLIAKKDSIKDKTILLDENAWILDGKCDLSHCVASFRAASTDDDDSSTKSSESREESMETIEEEPEETTRAPKKSRHMNRKKEQQNTIGLERSAVS